MTQRIAQLSMRSGKNNRPRGRHKSSLLGMSLRIEQLEDRINPIVGQVGSGLSAWFGGDGTMYEQYLGAPIVLPGRGYDGVVWINGPEMGGTGSLVQTGVGQGYYGHYILTAAHVLDPGGPETVTFTLPRPGYPDGVKIAIPVPAGRDYQILDNNYSNLGRASLSNPNEYDLALLKLTDPYSPAPDTLLVPPYGAERYPLYGAQDEVNKANPAVVTMVGYGMTGPGTSVGVLPNVDGYRDGLKRMGYNRLDSDGSSAVAVSSKNPTQATNDAANLLAIDFDNGRAKNDYFGVNYGISDTGLTSAQTGEVVDAFPSFGDSGGPMFLGGSIAGVFSRRSYAAPVTVTDVDSSINSSYGEVAYYIRVSNFLQSFLLPVMNQGANYDTTGTITPSSPLAVPDSPAYNLVLDMNYQVYGQSNGRVGNNGMPGEGPAENLTITVKNVGGNLQISVAGQTPNPSLDGVYYSAPSKYIKSLTLRGSPDNEIFKIEGPLNLASDTDGHPLGTVTIEGGGGRDMVVIDQSQTTADARYTFYSSVSRSRPFDDLGLAWAISSPDKGYVPQPTLQFLGISGYTLNGGSGQDLVRVQATSAAPIIINTNWLCQNPAA